MQLSGIDRSSIAFKLTASYVLASALVLLCSSGTLYWMLSRNLGRVEQRLLAQKVDLFLEDQATEPGDYAELFQQLSAASTGKELQRYWVRILDSTGHTLIETQGMGYFLPPDLFPAIQSNKPPKPTKRLEFAGGPPVRLIDAWSSAAGAQRRQIQVALDCGRDVELLRDYWGGLVLVVGLSLLALAGIGVEVVLRGLRPLNELGRAIGALTEERLSERMDREKWPVETHAVIDGFNDLSGRLNASFLRLQQFSADLAHELRTPIHNLRLQADVVLARPRSAEEYKLALENALEEYSRLTKMTESLLFLARVENGKQAVVPAKFEVHRLLESVLAQFGALASEKGLQLELAGAAEITADRDLLQLVLGNLLANACAFTPSGGTIKLAARTGHGSVIISVTDSGAGISKELQDKVFDRFFRADPARVHSGGAGLGLAIVKAVMDLHGGAARLNSEVGNGTQVDLIFPG
jgi:two-component system heavy metal sensor histidine kinase CusS